MTAEHSIAALLAELSAALAAVSDSPRLDAELLIGLAIDMPRGYLYAHPDDTLDEAALERLQRMRRRRLGGEPVAYITGIREFWSLPLAVNPSTLVPRPETELLVDLALREIPRRAEFTVLDLGTGSGAIALAIARERPRTHVVATDISPDALETAKLNARELGIANVEWRRGDWTAPVAAERFEVIVSNPPYVAEGDPALAALASEPRAALVAGRDGLDAIRRLAGECPAVLAPGGVFLFEHGAGQADEIRAILAAAGWRETACHDDLAGLPRVTKAQRRA